MTMKRPENNLPAKDARRVKSAERWLRAGNPLRALRKLQGLTEKAWAHPWTESVIWQAAQAVGNLSFTGASSPGSSKIRSSQAPS